MKSAVFISIIALLSFASCRSNKVQFTSEVQAKYNLSDDKLKRVQFYTSDVIVLSKSKDNGNINVQDGKIIIQNTKDCERIIIKKGTKCILEQIISPNKFIVSFELGEGKLLIFGNEKSGVYSIEAKEWKDGVGSLKYAKKQYATSNGEVCLLVKAKKLSRLQSRERIVKGRKI